ncbi:MAG TPA: Rnase Y domain-containing protein, partial [bacterium]|nr:Rnase Y domain-containing protein [bacterium]
MVPINTLSTSIIILLFICWGAIAFFVGYLWRRYIGERTIKAAEERAREIIREAENTALARKKELDIQTKEALYRLRSDFEKETKNKRKELQFLERRLNQREIILEKKAELLEKKEGEITTRERQISDKEQQIQQKVQEFENIIE